MGSCIPFLDAHAAGIPGTSGRRSYLVWKYRPRSSPSRNPKAQRRQSTTVSPPVPTTDAHDATSTCKDNPIPVSSFSCPQMPARSTCFAALVWRLWRAERRYGSVSISLFLPRTCSLGNGTLTHPHHCHRLALILARRGTFPPACLHMQRLLDTWKVTDSVGALVGNGIVYFFMYALSICAISVARKLMVSV